jgi:hypothetical protein
VISPAAREASTIASLVELVRLMPAVEPAFEIDAGLFKATTSTGNTLLDSSTALQCKGFIV